MYPNRRVNERTSLTRPLDSPNYVEFASLLRTRKTRIRQFQCCICATLIAIFTMALVVMVSYSVNHDLIDSAPNITTTSPESTNLSTALKLGFAPGSGSYTLFSNPFAVPPSNSVLVSNKGTKASMSRKLTKEEIKAGLEAGRQAINERLFADAAASMSPLPLALPEVRHRYAVSTCASVGALALAAVGELAATKRIENSRTDLGAPSAFGSFFELGWEPLGVCKQLHIPECPLTKYRTFDGSCNRPMQQGASMTPFKRLLPPNYADGIETPRRAVSGSELPSARDVSLKVHKPSPSSNPNFTVMLAVYGQFLDHDITATAISQGSNGTSISCCPPSAGHPECFPVPVSDGDPVFDVAGRTCMNFVRSAPAPQCKLGPRQQLNQVSAFIDGSAIYGSDPDTAQSLREFVGGRLRMQLTPDNRTLLPPSTNPNDGCNRETERLRGRYCFAAGDARANENLHLTTMHLLWARQHNRIAEQLAKINPSWNDETLYEESRRIVGAQLQHITYQEFIPIILGKQETNKRDLRPLKSGYRQWTVDANVSSTDPSIANSFATAAFRFAHTLLPGLMKVTNEQEGTSSYVELHRMLFNPYSLYSEGGVKSSVTSATRNMIQMTTTHVTSQLTNHLFEDPMANVSVPCGLDLVSLNIQRGRDHGLPGYTKWREYCGLGKTDNFSDLQEYLDPQVLQDISPLYESVHDIDLYTGALAEIRKAGAIVGPTFACLIADQFVALQRGDRFWYEISGQPHSFTEDQLTELRKTSLAKLICDSSDGITQIQAEVMRTIGPENPMTSCEDIPTLSFEPWRESGQASMLRASMPVNWTMFKNDINNTIKDVVATINSSRFTVDTDWLAFRTYINDTFADLRNQLSDLHSPKTSDVSVPKKLLIDTNSSTSRATRLGHMHQDWITFKNDLMKSLNTSIGAVGGGPAAVTKWVAFRQNIVKQFADLRDQIAAMKADIAPKLAMKNAQEQASIDQSKLMDTSSVKDVMIPAIFDWKNFKDNMISSLDDTISNTRSDMPPPGDPAWATFRNDIKDQYSGFKDKMDSQRSTTVPTELATEKSDAIDDYWLNYKTEIIKSVNKAVNKIKDRMPPPGDPAWITYRNEVMKTFKSTLSHPELSTLSGINENMAVPGGSLAASSTTKFTSNDLTNLTNDWLEFRTRINDSLSKVIQDIQSKKPTEVDPIAWVAFKHSAANDFAKLKNEIESMRTEWLAEISKSKPSKESLNLQTGMKKPGDSSTFDYTKYMKPVISPDDWTDFKKQINDTVMNILNTANSTGKFTFDELHKAFNESFTDLKNEISSLRTLIADTYNNKTAADWISFQAQLNSTVRDLVDGSKSEDRENVTRILLQTKDKLSDLQPPTNSPTLTPTEWIQYAFRVNKTISDTLNDVNMQKHAALMMRATEPALSSSDDPKKFTDWLIVPCLAGSFHVFTMASRFQIRV